MPRILMVRHGEAAASYTDDSDPGLSEAGHRQAARVTELLAAMRPLRILSSPLRRARETAAPLVMLDGGDLVIESRVSEIPSPGLSVEERGPWLRGVMSGRWTDQAAELIDWRDALIACLISQPKDCVIFSHFIAINVAVGHAEGRDELTVFRPGNTSITEFSSNGNELTLVRRGDEAVTAVN